MKLSIFVAFVLLLAGCETGRGGQIITGTPDQRQAEREVVADIAAQKTGKSVGFRCFPEGANPVDWQPDPRCPINAPDIQTQTNAPLDPTGIRAPAPAPAPVQLQPTQAAGQAANSIRQFGGKVVFTFRIQEGFNNPLYQSQVQERLISLPNQIQTGAGLDTVNRAGQLADTIWKDGFDSWARSGGLRPTEITIATFDRGTRRWRDEIWVNSRRVAACPVVEIKQFRLELEEGTPGIALGNPYIRSECRR